MKTKKILSLLIMLLAFSTVSYSQIQIPAGPVSGIWSAPHYQVNGDIFIATGTNLLISTGTTVEFTGSYSLDVNGVITAFGSLGNEIIFTSDPLLGWKGIKISNNSNSNTFDYCIFEYVKKSTIPCLANNSGAVYLLLSNNTTFSNCTFRYNNICNSGGGISFRSSRAQVEDCLFHDNIAQLDGGGIFIEGGSQLHSINGCSFENNTAESGGGAIWIAETELVNIEYSGFVNNTSNCSSLNSGGGAIGIATSNIQTTQTSVYINDCNFFLNIAHNITNPGNGGGVFAYQSGSQPLNLNIENCDIQNNTADNNGGGVFLENCQSDIQIFLNNIFLNHANNGAGVYMSNINNNMTVNNSNLDGNNFTDNIATTNGGGLYIVSSEFSDIINNFFQNNQAVDGGGVYISGTVIIHFQENNLDGNIASNNGGGSYLDASYSHVALCEFKVNNADKNGGGIYITNLHTSGNLNYFVNNLIVENGVPNDGGGIYSNADFYLYNNTIANNNAPDGSGGGFYLNSCNVTATNTIIWGNTAKFYPQAYPIPQENNGYSYCCCSTFTNPLTNCKNTNPMFTGSFDYRIQLSSSCFNTGNNNALYILPYDLDDTERILHHDIDIGAYEFDDRYKCGDITSNGNVIWDNHNPTGIDYIITCDIYINSGNTLTIQPGTEIAFDDGIKLDFYYGKI
ncbi:MAG: right-handed parallel beta-helix repeat-containing protein [Bacteroidota bacterium]|nr:right-handed parallel beta-helix repeat-containing protein [Bacteroidota bacterium]